MDKFFDLYFELPYAKSTNFALKNLRTSITHIPKDVFAFKLDWENALSIYADVLVLITQEKDYSLRKIEKSLSIFSTINNDYEPDLWSAFWILQFLLQDIKKKDINEINQKLKESLSSREEARKKNEQARSNTPRIGFQPLDTFLSNQNSPRIKVETVQKALYDIMKNHRTTHNIQLDTEEISEAEMKLLRDFMDYVYSSIPDLKSLYKMSQLR